MKTVIQSPGFKAEQKLLTLVIKKLKNLDRFNKRIIESQVCLKMEKSDAQENKICEIKLVIPGNDLFAVRSSQTFADAITGAVNALKHQLSDQKTEHKGGAVLS